MEEITKCHPRLQELASELIKICEQNGLQIKIGECLRTVEEQDAHYAKGRTIPGQIVTSAKGSSYDSMHQWGVAFDYYRDDGKGDYYNEDGFFQKVGKIGLSLGLEWGGNWPDLNDVPHFQLADWGRRPDELKRLYGTPEKFMETWKQ